MTRQNLILFVVIGIFAALVQVFRNVSGAGQPVGAAAEPRVEQVDLAARVGELARRVVDRVDERARDGLELEEAPLERAAPRVRLPQVAAELDWGLEQRL